MPSKVRQVNIRPDADTLALLDRVRQSASAAVGIPLSMTAIFRLGLLELERKYPPTGGESKKATERGKKARRK
jgi:hypothetical protein